MIIQISVSILLITLSIFILGKSVEVWQNAVGTLITSLTFSKHNQTETDSSDEEHYKPKYDVGAFTQRMKKLREEVKPDENGLFYYPIPPERSDVAGTEVITNEYEIQLDRR